MSDKISVASLAPADKDGWLTKQGGSIKTWKRRWMVLKGPRLHYFKHATDEDVQGVVVLEATTTARRETAKSTKKKAMFSVATAKRTYFMFADTPDEADAWVEALTAAVALLKSGAVAQLAALPAGVRASGGIPNEQLKEKTATTATAPSKLSGGISSLVPFIARLAKTQSFWEIWRDSLPDAAAPLTLAVSSGGSKASWRAAAPQSAFIQRMVDFFWDVGAPQVEIDRLNDFGLMIAPTHIGSWIEMSDQEGLDGGWFFPGLVELRLAIEAADAGAARDALVDWADEHAVTAVSAVGRDVGTLPPRQTEFRVPLPGKTCAEQLAAALDAYKRYDVPAPRDDLLAPLRTHVPAAAAAATDAPLALSLVISHEGIVRIGLIVPAHAAHDALRQAACADAHRMPASVPVVAYELQYLQEKYCYEVYKPGFDVLTHYEVN